MIEKSDDRLLRPSEVAALFRVTPKTVSRWARSGRIPSIRTLGGHHRFPLSALTAHIQGFTYEDADTGHDADTR